MSSRALRAATSRSTALSVVFAFAALVLLALTTWQLTTSRVRVTTSSGTKPQAFVTDLPSRGGRVCQPQGVIPADTGVLRMTIGTYGRPGPAFDVTFETAGTRILLGRRDRGWQEGVVDVPVTDHRTLVDGVLCFDYDRGARVAMAGETFGSHTVRGGPDLRGRISVLGLTDERRSALGSFAVLAERLPKGGPAVLGIWSAYLVALLFLAAAGLGARAIQVTDRGPSAVSTAARGGRLSGGFWRVPPAGRLVAAAALCIGVAWAILIPPFQVADETSHVAYVQYVAEEGGLPKEDPALPPYSEEERAVLDAIGFGRIIGRDTERAPSTALQEAGLRAVEERDYGSQNGGNASTASANPPLYYLLQAPVFLATSRLGLTDQVLAMRLVSVLLTSLSVLLAFLFVRELLPGSPWSWTCGGVACAFLPILGFAGAGVNPDGLLFASAAATLLLVARMLRRGLTTRRACLLGLSVAAGLLTKPLFAAFVPVALLGLLLAARPSKPAHRRALGLGVLSAIVPTLIVAVVAAVVFDHPYAPSTTSVAANAASGAVTYTRAEEASYLLQLFLPKLWFLADQIPGAPLRDVWIAGVVGIFGWIDYGFGRDASDLGAQVFQLLLVLGAVGLVRYRRAVLASWRLVLCCLVALAAVLGAIGVVDFQSQRAGGFKFQQARYLLPLLALYAGLFGLAAKGLGTRLAPFAAPVVWCLVVFHSMAALVLTADRYYL